MLIRTNLSSRVREGGGLLFALPNCALRHVMHTSANSTPPPTKSAMAVMRFALYSNGLGGGEGGGGGTCGGGGGNGEGGVLGGCLGGMSGAIRELSGAIF